MDREAIKVSSVRPYHSDAPFRQPRHYTLPFHDEMPGASARGIESRLVTGFRYHTITWPATA